MAEASEGSDGLGMVLFSIYSLIPALVTAVPRTSLVTVVIASRCKCYIFSASIIV